MQNYQNNYQDQQGNAIPGAVVVVRNYPSNTLATIYSDNGITPLPNPTTTDSLGMFNFFAANGTYSVTCTKAGFATQTFNAIQLFDASSSTSFTSLAITGTTQSTSTTTGALTVAGGVGIAKDVFVGGTVHGGVAATSGSVDGTTVGATTPSTGAFTTLSATGNTSVVALTATGAITPSQTAGIVGTTTNNNANSGSVGEFVTATGTNVPLTNNVAANIISISVNPGDWDIDGAVEFDANATTNITGVIAGINTSSGVLPNSPFKASILANLVTGGAASIVVPTTRISVSSLTTIYLVGQCSFNTSTATATGFIRARRIR